MKRNDRLPFKSWQRLAMEPPEHLVQCLGSFYMESLLFAGGGELWRETGTEFVLPFSLPLDLYYIFCSIWPVALGGVYFSAELFIVWVWA